VPRQPQIQPDHAEPEPELPVIGHRLRSFLIGVYAEAFNDELRVLNVQNHIGRTFRSGELNRGLEFDDSPWNCASAATSGWIYACRMR
jgi:hypothetical protein